MKIPPHNPDMIFPTDGLGNFSWTNGTRAQAAGEMIRHFGQQIMMGEDENEEALSIDLITDILHFLHSREIDPKQTLEIARMHFEAEVSG